MSVYVINMYACLLLFIYIWNVLLFNKQVYLLCNNCYEGKLFLMIQISLFYEEKKYGCQNQLCKFKSFQTRDEYTTINESIYKILNHLNV